MKIKGAVVIVTGAAGGIGEAFVAAFVQAGARAVVVSDRDTEGAVRVAEKLASYGPGAGNSAESGAPTVVAEGCDVADGAAVQKLVAFTEERFGRVDIFCSNAGILVEGGPELADAEWDRSWRVNVMAHVHAARAALPAMLARGSGHFLNVASAAGILTAPGAAPYATTKHAAVGFAEWLAITYNDRGIGVTVVCPEAVKTSMLSASLASGNEGVRRIAETGLTIDASAVTADALKGIEEGRFLVTTHPDTLKSTQRKWSDVDRWIKGTIRFLKPAS